MDQGGMVLSYAGNQISKCLGSNYIHDPITAATREITQKLPPLPAGKQAVEILPDFLRYMYTCGRTYIEQSHANGADLWTSVEDEIHPTLGEKEFNKPKCARPPLRLV